MPPKTNENFTLHEVDLKRALKRTFGREEFRPLQLTAITAVLAGLDTLVVLPTGYGKSLVYQLPAALESQAKQDPGFYLVISPLLALIHDQVTQLQTLGVAAESINSTTPPADRQRILRQFAEGKGSLLYVSPEQCLTPGFGSFLASLTKTRVKRVVVDEAHCVVEWGADFRKDYSRLGSDFRQTLGREVPMIALTGTAPPRMRAEIIANLKLRSPRVICGSSRRPHLHYEVRYVEDCGERLIDLLKFLKTYRARLARYAESAVRNASHDTYPGCGIIYCRSRASTEVIANELNHTLGRCAAAYHAGLPMSERNHVMQQWTRGDPKFAVIIATVAFGLGVDKPDTRFVVHFDLPQNIESYVQQTGRAGRDRKAARCILYYSAEGAKSCARFAKAANRLDTSALLKFAVTTNRCRHDMLSEYYDEGSQEGQRCEYACDFCKMPRRLTQRYEEWFSQQQ